MPRLKVILLFFLFVPALPSTSRAGVTVYDDLAVAGKPVVLRAETRGTLFAEGGRVVEFRVDGKSIGKVLSGGDGVAFKEYVPRGTGLREITAVSGEDSAKGVLLSVGKGTGVVFIDVTGSLLGDLFTRSPRQGSVQAVGEIASRLPVIYLSTLSPASAALKEWLRQKGFPPGPLLEWQGGRVFSETAEKGLGVAAVIGTAQVTESAARHAKRTFSFDGSGAAKAPSWKEIADSLKK
jgi:hypothetical protein